MRKIHTFILLFLFCGMGIGYAGDAKDALKCIDKIRYSSDPSEFNEETFKCSFKYTEEDENEKALMGLSSIFNSKDTKGLKAIQPGLKPYLSETELEKILNNNDDLELQKIYIAFSYAKAIHLKYFETPTEAGKFAKYYEEKTETDANNSKITLQGEIKDVKHDLEDVRQRQTNSSIGLASLFIWTLLVGWLVYFLITKQYKNRILKVLREELTADPELRNHIERIVEAKLARQAANNNSNNSGVSAYDVNSKIDRLRSEIQGDIRTQIASAIRSASNTGGTSSSTKSSDMPVTTGTFRNMEPIQEFSPAPSNGEFIGQYVGHYIEGISIYQLTINPETKNTGTFTIINQPAVLEQAASYPSSYLEPACILNGVGSIDRANSIQVTPGKIVKVGSNWKIEQKAELSWT